MEASRRSRRKKEAEIAELKRKIDIEEKRKDELQSLVRRNEENKFNAASEYHYLKKVWGLRIPDSHLEN